MADVDVARLKRLRSAISSSIDRSRGAKSVSFGMIDNFNSVQPEVRASLPESLYAEFDRMFPLQPKQASRFGGGDLIEEAKAAEQAKSKLELLLGWLEGVMDTAE